MSLILPVDSDEQELIIMIYFVIFHLHISFYSSFLKLGKFPQPIFLEFRYFKAFIHLCNSLSSPCLHLSML